MRKIFISTHFGSVPIFWWFNVSSGNYAYDYANDLCGSSTCPHVVAEYDALCMLLDCFFYSGVIITTEK